MKATEGQLERLARYGISIRDLSRENAESLLISCEKKEQKGDSYESKEKDRFGALENRIRSRMSTNKKR